MFKNGGIIWHRWRNWPYEEEEEHLYCKGEKVGPDMGLSVCLVGN